MMWRRPAPSVRLAAASVIVLAALSGHAQNGGGAAKGEWRYYAGDNGSQKYSPLDQITRDNVSRLRVAWRRPHVDPGPLAAYQGPPLRLSNNFRSTPIMVDGVLFASNAFGLVEAFDPGNGRTLWIQKAGADPIRAAGANRGVAYWSQGAEQRILTHRNQYLYAL